MFSYLIELFKILFKSENTFEDFKHIRCEKCGNRIALTLKNRHNLITYLGKTKHKCNGNQLTCPLMIFYLSIGDS